MDPHGDSPEEHRLPPLYSDPDEDIPEPELYILQTVPDIRKDKDIEIRSPDGRRKSAKIRKRSSRGSDRTPDVTFRDSADVERSGSDQRVPVDHDNNVRTEVHGDDEDIVYDDQGKRDEEYEDDANEELDLLTRAKNQLAQHVVQFADLPEVVTGKDLDDVFISMPSTGGDTTSTDDDGYDTDLGDKDEFRHKEMEHKLMVSRENTDIGHLSYEEACQTNGATPLRKVTNQLRLPKMSLQYVGFNVKQVKSLCVGLMHNTKVEDLDLEGNGIDGAGLHTISDLLKKNKFILRVSLKCNIMDEQGAVAVADFLQLTTWLTRLNLDGCQIGDHEMVHLSTGIQFNDSIKWLSLSHNKIGILGGVQLGRALGANLSLEYVDLSWNQIRGSGAVSVCKSLQKNHTIRRMDISWNGLGFEGSLAIGESLKTNKSVKILNMANNRINWDCVPYIGRGLRANKTLEILDLGHNPLSMEGCDELLDSVAKPTCGLKHLGLENIPINAKVAFNATEIARSRKFTLHHGGILSTHDIIGIQRVKRQDPMSLLTRYLATIGIRVVDLFRMFDTENRHYVSKEKFIRGLKRVRAPLDDDDMLEVVKRIGMSKGGQINYQLLASGVRNHIREERKEDMRQEALERKRREDRRRILQSDAVLKSAFYFPSIYNVYGTRLIGRTGEGSTPLAFNLSRQNSVANVSTPANFLPKLSSDSPRSLIGLSETESRRHTPNTPILIAKTTKGSKSKKKKKSRSKSLATRKLTSGQPEISAGSGNGHLPPLSSLRRSDPTL